MFSTLNIGFCLRSVSLSLPVCRMTVSKFSPKKVRVSVSVSVNSEQTCKSQARPTTFLNFGSSQNISSRCDNSPSPTRARKARSCSPVLKRSDHYQLPEITVTGPTGVVEGQTDGQTDGTDWMEVALQLEESSKKARQRERRKKAKKAKVSLALIYRMSRESLCLIIL